MTYQSQTAIAGAAYIAALLYHLCQLHVNQTWEFVAMYGVLSQSVIARGVHQCAAVKQVRLAHQRRAL